MNERAVNQSWNTTTSMDSTGFDVPTQDRRATPPVPGMTPDPVSRSGLRRHSEGPRGTSTRVSVWLKYAAYFLVVLLASSLTHAFLANAGTTQYGGGLMWFSAMLMFIAAAAGTVFFPNERVSIFAQMRHYVFGYCVFPGTVIAGIIWGLRDMLTSATASADTLTSLMSFAVPAVFITTMIIPPIIFIKALAGYYSLNRSSMDDAEMMSLYNRQDGLQR